MYFLLYVLLDRGFKNYEVKYKVLLNFCISVSFGILMEMFQHYFWVNRYGDFYDVLANTFGVIIGIFFTEFWLSNFIKSKNR